jgi:hypothetical protein
MKHADGGVWGYSLKVWNRFDPSEDPKEWPLPCYFRARRAICPGREGAHSHLFMPLFDFDPERRPCCPVCKKMLLMEERMREQAPALPRQENHIRYREYPE